MDSRGSYIIGMGDGPVMVMGWVRRVVSVCSPYNCGVGVERRGGILYNCGVGVERRGGRVVVLLVVGVGVWSDGGGER